MLFSHTYLAAARPAEAVYKEKGSRFIAFAFPVTSEEAFKKELDGLKKKFPDATHHC